MSVFRQSVHHYAYTLFNHKNTHILMQNGRDFHLSKTFNGLNAFVGVLAGLPFFYYSERYVCMYVSLYVCMYVCMYVLPSELLRFS